MQWKLKLCIRFDLRDAEHAIAEIGSIHRRDLLRSLMERGLRGVRLVIPDAHEGLKAPAKMVFGATWQRRRVHVMRHAITSVNAKSRDMMVAAVGTVLIQETREAAHEAWRGVPSPTV